MEYEYALGKGIPIISFLHKNPDKIPVGKSKVDKDLKRKLDTFKKLVQQKMCKYYETSIELGSVVSRSLVRLIKDKPQPGWVKSTYIPSEESTKEILELTKQVETLKNELEKSKNKAPEGTESLSQGDDKLKVAFTVIAKGDYRIGSERYESSVELTWNEIFAEISPLMIDESSERPIRSKINNIIMQKRYNDLAKKFKIDQRMPNDFNINDNDFQTIKIQFRALNLITESSKKRGVHDKQTYWVLTPFGDTVMTRLRAIRK